MPSLAGSSSELNALRGVLFLPRILARHSTLVCEPFA
jgi:hypothetical protein